MKYFIIIFSLLFFYSNADCLVRNVSNNYKTCIKAPNKNYLQEDLHRAILNDSSAEIISSVQAGANINLVKDGKSPILSAILYAKNNSIETLLKLGAKVDAACGQYIIKMNNVKILLLFVKQGFLDFDIKEVVKIINDSCAYVDYYTFAIDLIVELINRGYNVNEFWIPILKIALYRPVEGQEMVRFMLLNGANPNHIIKNQPTRMSLAETPIQVAAAYYCNKKIVEILIEFGADINEKFKVSRVSDPITILSYNIEMRGRHYNQALNEVIEFLLSIGANL